MGSVYDLKPRFQNLLRPLCRSLAAAGVTANQVTIAAAALSIAAGIVCVAIGHPARWLLLPAVLLVRMGLNAIDGMLAREHGQKSPLGAILNELGDVVSDAALYLPLVTVGWHSHAIDAAIEGRPLLPDAALDRLGWWPAGITIAFVVMAILTEMAGVLAVPIGASRNYAGPMGKSDRAVVVGVLGLLLGLGVVGRAATAAVLAIATLLAVATIVNRSRQALREAEGIEPEETEAAATESDPSSSHVLS